LTGELSKTIQRLFNVNDGAPALITQDRSSRAYYVALRGSVARLNADSGACDTNYGQGCWSEPPAIDSGGITGLAVDSSGFVVIGGRGYVARLDTLGMLDPTFGTSGVVHNVGDVVGDIHADLNNRVYALGSASRLLRIGSDGRPDSSFSMSPDIQALNGPSSQWNSLQFVDNSESSAYLVGGAVQCSNDCSHAATTAVIAKVKLVSASGGSGGGGACAWWDLCGLLFSGLWRALRRLPLKGRQAARVTD